MKRRYRADHRRTKLGILLLLLLFIAVFMVSCVAGTDALWIRSVFGTDLQAYGEENCIRFLTVDCYSVDTMCRTLEMLLGNTTKLEPFRNSRQAVSLYRDRILNAMLCENYLKYTGDRTAQATVAATDPTMSVCSLIPGADFEAVIRTRFGGNDTVNRNGEYFTYLDRAGYYSIPIEPWQSSVRLSVISCEETEHVFRLCFSLTDSEGASDSYIAFFVKRTDGSFYLRGLQEAV